MMNINFSLDEAFASSSKATRALTTAESGRLLQLATVSFAPNSMLSISHCPLSMAKAQSFYR